MIQKMFLSMALLSLCLLVSTASFGQEKIILKAEKVTDFYPKNLLKGKAKGYLFKVGEESDYQVIGRKGKNIEAILMQDEEAYKQFKRFKRKLATGKIIFWTGVGSYVTVWGTPYQADITYQDVRNRSLIRTSILIIGGTATILLRNRAMHNLEKAVAIYNVNLEKS